MNATGISPDLLGQLQPLTALSAETARALAGLCRVEQVPRDGDPFRVEGVEGQSVYLIKGELKLSYPDESTEVLVGGTEQTRHPLGRHAAAVTAAKAITDVELIRIDDEVLDILMTWDQVIAAHQASQQQMRDKAQPAEGQPDWLGLSGMRSAQHLALGAFAALPAAHLDELLRRFARIRAARGEAIVVEGDEGDYYYLIESGRCRVTRKIAGEEVDIAELKPGDPFGEEALLADTVRNATVSMKTDGVLLRLAKHDFIELLREPLLQRIDMEAALDKAAHGAIWLDVRFPAEHLHDRLPGALNIPLNEIRNLFASLQREREYIVYCQSGRRSSAAAFLLSQRGFKAFWLEGGLAGVSSGRHRHA